MSMMYEAMAKAVAKEGVDTHFTLMGDANMHFATAMAALPGVQTIHGRHEHCVCGMAMGYHSATGTVGFASVTCGPGFTQIMTALVMAARNRVPLVVFAGETPLSAKWYGQRIEQQPIATACGAHYISAHDPKRIYQFVREAFYVARMERRPVVLGIPHDLLKMPAPDDLGEYETSSTLVPQLPPQYPHPDQIAAVAELIASAKRPVMLGGRGVIASDGGEAVSKLGDRAGALLCNTLVGRGLFDKNPYSLGIVGGYASALARELLKDADLVVAFGASMSFYTVEGGRLFSPHARVVQVNTEPEGYHHGLKVAHDYLVADARLTAEALYEKLGEGHISQSVYRTAEIADKIKNEPHDLEQYQIDPGTLDPRGFYTELAPLLPGNYDVVSGNGHFAYFHTPIRGGEPGRYHTMRDFGAIGNSLSYAIGVAAARRNGQVVLFEGDGGLIMHAQELETIKRHGLKLLIVCQNDGGYGAEIHKLRGDGIDDSEAHFGYTDFVSIARGYGHRGERVDKLGDLERLFQEYEAGADTTIWNVITCDKVLNPRMRQNTMGHRVR